MAHHFIGLEAIIAFLSAQKQSRRSALVKTSAASFRERKLKTQKRSDWIRLFSEIILIGVKFVHKSIGLILKGYFSGFRSSCAKFVETLNAFIRKDFKFTENFSDMNETRIKWNGKSRTPFAMELLHPLGRFELDLHDTFWLSGSSIPKFVKYYQEICWRRILKLFTTYNKLLNSN